MKKLIIILLLLCIVGTTSAQEQSTFSKVGDSLSYSWAYLFDFRYDYDLAGYSYLQPAIDYYADSFLVNPPIAAHPGWTSGDVLNNTSMCKDLSPLVCAYAVERPQVALILLGTNDVAQNVPVNVYQDNMQHIMEITQERGITPVLITIPPFEGKDVDVYNSVVRNLSRIYGTPLIDYYAAVVNLPNRGLSNDGVHPSMPPDRKYAYFDNEHLKYGYNVLNLRILEMLYRLK